MSEQHQHYLRDLGYLIKEYARNSIQESRQAMGSESEDYKTGYMMAFHRIVTLMQQQANAFDIELDELALSDIDESEFFEKQEK